MSLNHYDLRKPEQDLKLLFIALLTYYFSTKYIL